MWNLIRKVRRGGSVVYTYIYILGWSDFSFLWNFEKKQVGVVTFGKKKHVFIKKNLIKSKTETRRPLKKKFHRVPL